MRKSWGPLEVRGDPTEHCFSPVSFLGFLLKVSFGLLPDDAEPPSLNGE